LQYFEVDSRDKSRCYSFTLGLDPVSRVEFPRYKVLLKDCVMGGGNRIIDNLAAGGCFAPVSLATMGNFAADCAFITVLLMLEEKSIEMVYGRMA
jgi:hypothetical protein